MAPGPTGQPAPSTAAIHLAESRRRLPALSQYSCTPASGALDEAAASSGSWPGQVGQMTFRFPSLAALAPRLMTALDLPGDHVPKGADRDRPFE